MQPWKRPHKYPIPLFNMWEGEGQGPLGGFEVRAEMALRLFSIARKKKYTSLGGDFRQSEAWGE
jgi:hypothetical protein